MAKDFDIPVGAITVTVVSAVMSVFGGILILYTYYAMPNLHNFARKLLYLTIADMLTSTGNGLAAIQYSVISGDQRNQTDAFCVAQSVVTTFSSMSSFFWTCIIAVYLFSLVLLKKDLGEKRRTVIIYHIIGWVLPGIITMAALIPEKLGRGISAESHPIGTGPWCWIKTEGRLTSENIVFMFFTGKGWEIATYLISFALYMLMKVFTLKERRRDPSFNWNKVNKNLGKEDERFCLAWVVLYLLRLWGTFRFFLAISRVKNNTVTTLDSVLVYFQSYGDSGQAFWNFILFCLLDAKVRQRMKISATVKTESDNLLG